MNILSFTGSRAGMTPQQLRRLLHELSWHSRGFVKTLLRVGGCVGSDYQAQILALSLGMEVHLYPALNMGRFQEALAPATAHRIYLAKKPLVRNRDMVDGSHTLYAAPTSREEVKRSGTWATIRYACCANKGWRPAEPPDGVIAIYPDGLTEDLRRVYKEYAG
jgi:hypothetical protein